MLTPSQVISFRAAAFLVPAAAALIAAGNVQGLLAWANTETGGKRWLPAADVLTIEEAPAYTGYDSITQGKRDSWRLFLAHPRDFGRSKVRAWVVDIWGSATAASNTEAILSAATAPSTNVQVALGGTAKATGTVSAVDTAFEGQLEVLDAALTIFKDDGGIWTP